MVRARAVATKRFVAELEHQFVLIGKIGLFAAASTTALDSLGLWVFQSIGR
jgi:hypothetical protein